jgi:hypothetical protein
VDTNGGRSLKIPTPHFVPGGFIRVDPGWTYIDQVPGKRTLERAVGKTAEIDSISNLHGTQIAVARELLVKPRTPIAVNAAVHLMLDELAQILIAVGSLLAGIAPYGVSAGNRFILEKALPSLVAYRAVVRVIDHEPFDHLSAEFHRLLIRGGNDHAVLSIDHATHLNALERAMDELHGTHPAGPHGSQSLMIAKPRYHDPKPLGGINYLRSFRNLYLEIVNNHPGHVLPL